MLRRRGVNTVTAILLAVVMGLNFYVSVPWWGFTLVILSWFLITLGGSFFIGWNYHMTSLHANKNIRDNQIALTFDDGPHPDFTPKVLDLLNKYRARATFFCVGRNIEEYPTLFSRILAEGHSVGNHTYGHSRAFGFFGTEKVIDELNRTKEIIMKLSGQETKLYRPAFAVTNPMIERAVKHLGLYSIGWNIRSLDTTMRTGPQILKRITSRISKGDVVLLHDTSQKSVVVLEQLLLFLQDENLQSVTVDQLLEIEAYA